MASVWFQSHLLLPPSLHTLLFRRKYPPVQRVATREEGFLENEAQTMLQSWKMSTARQFGALRWQTLSSGQHLHIPGVRQTSNGKPSSVWFHHTGPGEGEPTLMWSANFSRTLLIQSIIFPQPFWSPTLQKMVASMKSPAGTVHWQGPCLGSSRKRLLPASHTNKQDWRYLPAEKRWTATWLN